ncbi:choice-of-anchor I family protein [Paenibacillus chartarius]|uniref:Choice-of-anchor I family protein n=1 Tax=Paenibacillus chartarius TaxID=747481 RepID=A0ABV6DMY5_9BACL
MITGLRRKWKRSLALLLALELAGSLFLVGGTASAADAPLPGTPYASNGSYDKTVPHVMINQVYGTGAADSGVLVSHGFIELYNPTDAAVNLNGWSLHYSGQTNKNGPTGDWMKLDLTGTIPTKSYYLITGSPTGATSPRVNLAGKGDQSWDIFFANKGMKVVLTSTTAALDNSVKNPFAAKPDGYVDMIGTGSNDSGSTIDGYETAHPTGSAEGTSKKKSVRRKEFADTDNNKADFQQIDFETISSEDLALVRPRSSTSQALGISTTSLNDARVGSSYSATLAVYGGSGPYKFEASGLPSGMGIATVTGGIYGTPAESTVGTHNVKFTVTDSVNASVYANLVLNVQAAPAGPQDLFSITKIGSYQAASPNEDGGVAEIVKFNKENGKFYLVNGASNPPSLDIVSLGNGASPEKVKSVAVKELSETEGFVYGDLTSVDVNTAVDRVFLAVQEADHRKNGKILVLDYDGNLLDSYEAGAQPDMIKSTADGRYVLTANEGEPREQGQDPKGSITILDTTTGVVGNVYFDNPAVIDDAVHIRGAADPSTDLIVGKGSKADAAYDLEPEYIAISENGTIAYVTLQENNAIATIDIVNRTVTSVKGLGLKDLNDPNNKLDLIKDDKALLQNVPFKGIYMPDGIAASQVGDKTYLFTANEGDATEWPGRENATEIGKIKSSLTPGTAAADFLSSTSAYNKVEVASDWGKDGVYLYGGRSFSVWDASTMTQVFDSGKAFEQMTAERLPSYFNASNTNSTLDSRSTKKGPEPEDIRVGKVGNKTFAFIGLERIGGIMAYDVTNPLAPVFASYVNTRDFAAGLQTDTGPEGIEFIPATISPTGKPLLLVAYEVGGTVGVLELNVTKVTLNTKTLNLTAGESGRQLTADVVGTGAATVTWTSSNTGVASVNADGFVTPVSAGTAVITAISADGYGIAEAVVTVASASSSGGGEPGPSSSVEEPANTDTAKTQEPAVQSTGNEVKATVEVHATTDAQGNSRAVVTAEQLASALKSLEQSGTNSGKTAVLEIKANVSGNAKQAVVELPSPAIAQAASSKVAAVSLNAGIGTLTFDKAAVAAVSQAAGQQSSVSVSIAKTDAADVAAGLPANKRSAVTEAVQDRPVFDFNVTVGDKRVSDFAGGLVDVNVPYTLGAGEDPNAIIVYYISDSGELVLISNAKYDPATKQLTFSVEHFSHYAIGYNKVDFTDTANSFAKDEITYLSARNIVNGVETSRFAPTSTITRADFALILARIAGAELSKPAATRFKDVQPEHYYAAAVEWAAAYGIVNGIEEGKFDPTARVTRGQMVAMIVRTADSLKFSLPATHAAAAFADQASIPAYAVQAAQAAQQAGIVSGKTVSGQAGVQFAANDTATREEAAKMLAVFMQLLK